MPAQIVVAPEHPITAPSPWRQVGLIGIKTVHTLAFFSIGSCLCYFAYSALIRRSDHRAAIAGVVVTGEALVYAANGFRGPLTEAAERLGSEHGSVADIYLPPCLRRAPAVHHRPRLRGGDRPSRQEPHPDPPATTRGRFGGSPGARRSLLRELTWP